MFDQKLANAKIAFDSPNGRGRLHFVRRLISEFEGSPEFRMMEAGRRYYKNKNDILKRKRQAIGEDGALVEVPNRPNNRLSHPYARKLLDQKVNFLLAKPFSVSSANESYVQALQPYFDKKFMRLLIDAATEAVSSGRAWLKPFYDAGGKLNFQLIRARQIVPVWRDLRETELSGLAYSYFIEDYKNNGQICLIRHVEYYEATSAGYELTRYIDEGSGLSPGSAPGGYDFTIDNKPYKWDKIPFIPFQYNPDATPLLALVKPLIDAYDLLTSDEVNHIEDTPNPVLVVRNYGGANLAEFRHNLNTHAAVSVLDDGGVDALSLPLDITSAEKALDRLNTDIFSAGRGLDLKTAQLSNISTETFRLMYNELETDCLAMGAQFADSLGELLRYVKQDLLMKGGGDFTGEDEEIIWNTDVPVNESETIRNILSLQDILSRETLLEQNPWVKDPAQEEKRLETEAKRRDDYNGFPEADKHEER